MCDMWWRIIRPFTWPTWTPQWTASGPLLFLIYVNIPNKASAGTLSTFCTWLPALPKRLNPTMIKLSFRRICIFSSAKGITLIGGRFDPQKWYIYMHAACQTHCVKKAMWRYARLSHSDLESRCHHQFGEMVKIVNSGSSIQFRKLMVHILNGAVILLLMLSYSEIAISSS